MNRGAPAPAPVPSVAPGRGAQRRLRVAEEIRHLLADIFLRAPFRDPELAAARITVTEVQLAPDLRQATAFVARLGRPDIAELLPALARATPFLQRAVAERVRLRRAPTLTFATDATLERVSRIEEVLRSPAVARDLAGH